MNPPDSNRSDSADIGAGGVPGRQRVSRPARHLPSPSIWPVVVAAGVTLVMFGFIIHPGFVAMGILVMILGVARWIGELLRG